jgi:hypothetical protein
LKRSSFGRRVREHFRIAPAYLAVVPIALRPSWIRGDLSLFLKTARRL